MRIVWTLALAAAIAAGAASAGSPASAIAKLNAQRSAHGIPGRIKENKQWSKACALHNRYQKRNGAFGHSEAKGKPGYTKEGNWAAMHAVLGKGTSWAQSNPFEYAPIHLAQLLAPQLAVMGVDDSGGFVCATTWPGHTRFGATNAVYTYPGDGTKGWRRSETAREFPFTPGEAVGLPAGTETGPYLYVFADGPWSRRPQPRITQAELRGPVGPVDVKVVDRTTPKVGLYFPRAGLVIPVRPLEPGTAYDATVTVSGAGTTLTHAWRFTTATG